MGVKKSGKDPGWELLDEANLAIFRKVGQILAHARQEQKLTIKQVAHIIHIRQQYLMDLEEGRLFALPGRVYIFGFIRTYARFLKLEGEELIRQINQVSTLPDFERSQVPFALTSEEGPTFRILMISIVLAVCVAIGSYILFKPYREAPAVIEDKPVALEEDHLTPQEQILVTPPSQARDNPSLNSESLLLQPEETDNLPGQESLPASYKQESPNLPDVSSVKKVILKARESSWVEVRDKSGHILFRKILQRGETYLIPSQPGITISIGNAGGLDIFVEDLKLPSLGKAGEVRRGIEVNSLRKNKHIVSP